MAVAPEALLDAAAEIGVGGREVDWRNAASRGYYAAHHRCIPLVYGDASAQPGHGELIGRLTDAEASAPRKQVGYLLMQCKQLRERADYRIADDFEQADAETALDTSRRIFRFADGA